MLKLLTCNKVQDGVWQPGTQIGFVFKDWLAGAEKYQNNHLPADLTQHDKGIKIS